MDQIDYLIGELGLYIFPLRPETKQPYAGSISAHTTNSITDAKAMHKGIKKITSYSKSMGKDVESDFTGCIWAINTGMSDLCVVDIDEGWHEKQKRQKEGMKNFLALKKEHGYPKTFTVKTPSGGFHIITKGKCKSDNSVIAKDVDIKSDGAYVVAPLTTSKKGTYEILHKVPFADTPQWLLKHQGQREERKEIMVVPGEEMTDLQRAELEEALSFIDPDCDHDTFRDIGMGINHEYPGEDGFEVYNDWSKGALGDFGCPESYTHDSCRSKWLSFGKSDTPGADITIATVFHHAREAGFTAYVPSASQAFADAPPSPTYAEQLRDALAQGNPTLPAKDQPIDLASKILTMDTILKMPEYIPDPVVENMFEPGDKFCIIGKSKTKKTFFMFNMACCIAAGAEHFLGSKILKPRRVLVIQYEVKDSHFLNRARATAKALQLDKGVMLKNLGVLNLMGEQWNWPSMHAAISHFRAEVVIFDPIYKMFEGDENAAEGWRLLLGQYDLIRKRTGAAVGYVHHDAKGKAGDREMTDRGSGSGMLARDYDFGITLTPHADFDNATVIEFLSRNFKSPESVTITWDNFPACIADPGLEARAKCSANTDKPIRKPVSDRLWQILAEQFIDVGMISADKMAKDVAETAAFMSLPPDERLGAKTLRERLMDLIRVDKVVGVGSESVIFEGRVDESTGKAVAQVRVSKLGERL